MLQLAADKLQQQAQVHRRELTEILEVPLIKFKDKKYI
jgi:hypothetical protein